MTELNAGERIDTIRKHLELAYGHDNFWVDEIVNNPNKTVVRINIYFTDKKSLKKFSFENGDVVSVEEVDKE